MPVAVAGCVALLTPLLLDAETALASTSLCVVMFHQAPAPFACAWG
jgi:hypothetical protein